MKSADVFKDSLQSSSCFSQKRGGRHGKLAFGLLLAWSQPLKSIRYSNGKCWKIHSKYELARRKKNTRRRLNQWWTRAVPRRSLFLSRERWKSSNVVIGQAGKVWSILYSWALNAVLTAWKVNLHTTGHHPHWGYWKDLKRRNTKMTNVDWRFAGEKSSSINT